MSETVTVRRGGSYLTIPSGAVERYMAKGYDVVDEKDNVIQTGTPNDINVLKHAYEEHVKEIKRLKEEIARLKSQPKPEPDPEPVVEPDPGPQPQPEPTKQEKLFGSDEKEPEKKTTSKRAKKSV